MSIVRVYSHNRRGQTDRQTQYNAEPISGRSNCRSNASEDMYRPSPHLQVECKRKWLIFYV